MVLLSFARQTVLNKKVSINAVFHDFICFRLKGLMSCTHSKSYFLKTTQTLVDKGLIAFNKSNTLKNYKPLSVLIDSFNVIDMVRKDSLVVPTSFRNWLLT